MVENSLVNMMKKLLIIIFCLSGQILLGQQSYYPRDTNYTIESAYRKIKKKHPKTTPVYAKRTGGIIEKRNLVYLVLDNGRQLHLDVFFPRKNRKKPKPGILMIHGGGWISGAKENLIPMAQHLAKQGYVTVTAEYRLGGEAPYPAAVHDLKTAVRWMRAQAISLGIDTNKIAAYGCSAGAHLASLLGTTNEQTLFDVHPDYVGYSATIQAVLNIDGIVSFIHPEAKPEWTGRSANAWLGAYEKHYERWKEASPLEYAGADTPPFLFVNSSYPRFHAGRDDLFKILDKHQIYHEAHTFEGSPHGFWLVKPWFKPTCKYTVDFLEKVFD